MGSGSDGMLFFFDEDIDANDENVEIFSYHFASVVQVEMPETSLFDKETELFEGQFTLKISLAKNLYRIISISSESTLEDLHRAILDLYGFDNDHLWAFYLDGNMHSTKETYYGDNGLDLEMEGKPAEEYSLGVLGLYEGKEFVYRFDFGACWDFAIQVLFMDEGITGRAKYNLIDKVGEAPEQYPSWE